MGLQRQLKPLAAVIALLTSGSAAADDAAAEFPTFDFSGSFQSLATVSETPINGDDYWSDLNRLRLDFDAKLNSIVGATAIIDNELLIGSVIDTEEFQLVKDLQFDSNTRWDLDTLVADNDNLVWRASVYRAYLKLTFDKVNVVAGRQRIAWGAGRIWNPTDLFNPLSPLQIDQSQRDGVDSISAEYFFGDLSSIDVVYALGENSDLNSAGARVGTNVKGYDLGLIAGQFRRDNVIGGDFSGSIGNAGFRGEATYINPNGRSAYTRLVLSMDYSWPNTFYLLLEYFYNGGNLGGTNVPDEIVEARARRFNGEIITKNQNFVATGVGYEFTPLLRFNGLAILDVDEGGVFFSPSVSWNITPNVDWSLGVQVFSGDADSEYGDNENVAFTTLRVYF